MLKNKFTFKTVKPIGKWRAFYDPTYFIKIKKDQIGQIIDQTRGAFRSKDIKIMFQIIKSDINEDNCPNCSWKWITLAKTFNSVQEAKDWLNSEGVFEQLNTQFNFYKN